MISSSASPIILTENLSRYFGKFVAVDAVSFFVERGEIFGYLGANGAGKSTTIRMLCGLLKPSAGRALINDLDVAVNPQGVKHSLGYMSQKFSLYLDLLVEENLEFFGGAYGLEGKQLKKRISEVLDHVDLSSHRRTRTGDLPGGIRQRLALASALLHQPEILFLDEPTAGVDPRARRIFWRLIRELAQAGKTIFVTTHYMDEAEYCHRLGLMVDGRLVALDTPSQLKKKHVPGRLIKIEGRQVAAALAFCQRRAGVIKAAPFGATAHVQIDEKVWSATQIQADLQTQGLAELAISDIEPTLEDVFLSVVERP